MSPIPETEDVYDPATDDPQIDMPCPAELISAMANANSGIDKYEIVGAEEFDIDMAFSSSDDGKSDLNLDSGNSLDSPIMKFLHHLKPAVGQAATTQKHCPGGPKGSSSMPVTEPVMATDPETSSFVIQCAIHRPDGTDSPYQVSSNISLNALCHSVAEKLEHFPAHISLHYQLDSDEVKAVDKATACMMIHMKNKPSAATGTLEGDVFHQEVIAQLQESWRCRAHLKGPKSPMYCYTPSGSSVCYTLSHSDLLYWVTEIISENATVDEKPIGVCLSDASHAADGVPRAFNALPYGYFPPFFLLPWPYPMGSVGQFCPSTQPSQPTLMCHTGRVSFAPFGHILREKGFLCLSQLTPKFVQLQDLQAWLGSEVGTAILIMQYAKEDLNAVRSEVHVS
ncbi:hypothetical protein EDD16DRAFT_1516577 [Pisolithus croceorrhizus]|nr:hypothetical protein EDD16DRAFT_1516577 [Pisolithus croceorrhizus]